MTQLLLDHPWKLDASPDAGSILLSFYSLLENHGLQPVPFIPEQDWAELLQERRINYAGRLIRAVSSLVRIGEGAARATPIGAPADLSDDWMVALRDSMQDLDDWRCPQVVVPEIRRALWPQSEEIEIEIEASQGQTAPERYERILVVLETYDLHRYALSDRDPWNLVRINPPSNQRVTHPCLLPKPPELAKCFLEEIDEKAKVCGQDQDTHLYYLPPDDWSYRSVVKEKWRRRGHAFPFQSDPRPHHSGWIDREHRIWEWDLNERHWDVQSGKTYQRVSHTGRKL
jgi:hypothetical protein